MTARMMSTERVRLTTASESKGTAIIYCRVSTKGQEDDGTSLDSQESACREYAKHLGYAVGRVSREVYTGAELWDRPKLAQDRADLKTGQWQALIVYSIDRLTRDPIHLAIIAEECDRAGVALELVTEPLDQSPEGQLIAYVKGYAAKIEREKIRERMLRGKRTRALAGKIHNAGPELYGYRRDKELGKRVIYEPEAQVVREIYHWYILDHLSLRAIARRLNERGTPPPSVGKKHTIVVDKKPQWSAAEIQRRLSHPAYKGEAIAWRYHRENNRRYEMRPPEEWLRLPEGTVPALVSSQLWDAAQERFRTNIGEYTRNMAVARQYLLRGLIVCAVCGRAMYAQPDKHNKRLYFCSARRRTGTSCGGSQTRADEVEAWVWEKVSLVLKDPSIIAEEVEKQRDAGDDPVLLGDLGTARQRLAKVERQQERLIARFSEADDDNDFPWDLVEREIARTQRERSQLQVTIAQLEHRIAQQQQTVTQLQNLQAFCERVADRLSTFGFDEQRMALEALAIRVIASGRDWRLEGRIPTEEGATEDSILLQTSGYYQCLPAPSDP